MDIRGFLETSMLDWDGKISSVVFLSRCSFKCPFCHNYPLLFEPEKLKKFEVEEIKKYLAEHKNWIDAVVISGGEPTVHQDLGKLIGEFKDMGFLVKLDTNGTNPAMLRSLMENIDYVAMDIKAPLNEKYDRLAGTSVDLEKIKESIRIIMGSGKKYEFRTTVVPGLLSLDDLKAMSGQIAGAMRFVIQQFEPGNCLDESLRDAKPYPKEKILEMASAAKEFIPNTVVRGV